MKDERIMICCCSDGTRPVIFRLERIDIPKTVTEAAWLEKQNFHISPDGAMTGESKC